MGFLGFIAPLGRSVKRTVLSKLTILPLTFHFGVINSNVISFALNAETSTLRRKETSEAFSYLWQHIFLRSNTAFQRSIAGLRLVVDAKELLNNFENLKVDWIF